MHIYNIKSSTQKNYLILTLFTTIRNINKKINLLEKTMNDTKYEIEYSKDTNAKARQKTAKASFF